LAQFPCTLRRSFNVGVAKGLLDPPCVDQDGRRVQVRFCCGDPILKPSSAQGLGSRNYARGENDAKLLQIAGENF
jgi:hypothetical protein